MKNELESFGGKVMVFSGDQRQILPILKNATRAETVTASFKSFPLWEHLRQKGEGRYAVNAEIGENDICLPRGMCVFPEPVLALDEETKEDEDDEYMEPPRNSIFSLR
ncbi:hypothetical protein PC117_g14329 [Phytophthora cactorum]|uniref:ATP-dependent DNA helicase n=1 Tax=Phytophthora cactorum TaxID=29920 RepID=A0A8T1CSB2_9STRA|nr:hypothetical protein PC117_g14329 [Phytophthora cactorum]